MATAEKAHTTGAVMQEDVFGGMLTWYNTVVYERHDPRTSEWFLVSNPWLIFGLMGAYLLLVLKILPKFMENRKPYSLRGTLIGINIFQIVANAWIVYEMIVCGWGRHYKFLCQPVDYTRSYLSMRMARAVYYFFLIKIFDFSDTVLFVLRKKYNQVTFLHVFHHITTLWLAWIVVKYAPGGTGTFAQMMNAVIHVLMYGYYLLAALGPWIQPYLWWKKYLTTMQMVQFVIGWTQNVYGLMTGCDYSRPIVYFYLPILTSHFILFYNFYQKSYVSKDKQKGEDTLKKRNKKD
ncbi:elongation of very long chain fatty acids protein 1-like [Ischnura elegans]|uniref:elongation of very long chain fatty acids protein 1-like n=1 Tax=Ischnura elegans TaxID=197161 RepID=UPI001ED88849|nr:elongation of very long chain fatty acids protein 1-like [Ischnura elegans]XP_046387868.1 elongation of very long chain fatty acids protein 1-like [Ischnura elegans]XP_046387869.1 elongation of very long chain fatty acids protein 1-like [Ischnura elegans]XP_046387872.1 elongation of very long chain fatty acids protein 1-like [Ischnura elegans]